MLCPHLTLNPSMINTEIMTIKLKILKTQFFIPNISSILNDFCGGTFHSCLCCFCFNVLNHVIHKCMGIKNDPPSTNQHVLHYSTFNDPQYLYYLHTSPTSHTHFYCPIHLSVSIIIMHVCHQIILFRHVNTYQQPET